MQHQDELEELGRKNEIAYQKQLKHAFRQNLDEQQAKHQHEVRARKERERIEELKMI